MENILLVERDILRHLNEGYNVEIGQGEARGSEMQLPLDVIPYKPERQVSQTELTRGQRNSDPTWMERYAMSNRHRSLRHSPH